MQVASHTTHQHEERHEERIVVLDTETTGLGKGARVIEVACIVMDAYGTITEEWDTLVRPDPFVTTGAVHIHQITDEMVRDAPTFLEIADELSDILHGAVIAAHNLSFDVGMLRREFQRISRHVDFGKGIDTIPLTKYQKLGVACKQHNISLECAHCALDDARAAALLLRALRAKARDAAEGGAKIETGIEKSDEKSVEKKVSLLCGDELPAYVALRATVQTPSLFADEVRYDASPKTSRRVSRAITTAEGLRTRS